MNMGEICKTFSVGGGVNYQTCFCKITNGSFIGFLNSNKEYHVLRDFITSNDISEIEVSFPETTNRMAGKVALN